MAEQFNDCPWFEITREDGTTKVECSNRLASVPMIDDGIRAVPFTPKNMYGRSGGRFHDAVLSVDIYADDADDGTTEIIAGTVHLAKENANYLAPIMGKEVSIAVQMKRKEPESTTEVAGTASENWPICTVKGKVFQVPTYLGGAWGDSQVYSLSFALQDEPSWAPQTA